MKRIIRTHGQYIMRNDGGQVYVDVPDRNPGTVEVFPWYVSFTDRPEYYNVYFPEYEILDDNTSTEVAV